MESSRRLFVCLFVCLLFVLRRPEPFFRNLPYWIFPWCSCTMPDEGQGRRVLNVYWFVWFETIWTLSLETFHAGSTPGAAAQCQTKDTDGEFSAFVCLFACLCVCLFVYMYINFAVLWTLSCFIETFHAWSTPGAAVHGQDEGQERKVLGVYLFVCLSVLQFYLNPFFRNLPCRIFPWCSCSMPDEGQGRSVFDDYCLFVCLFVVWLFCGHLKPSLHKLPMQDLTLAQLFNARRRTGTESSRRLFVCLFCLFCGHLSPLFISCPCRIFPWCSCSMPDEGQGRRVLGVWLFVCLFVCLSVCLFDWLLSGCLAAIWALSS